MRAANYAISVLTLILWNGMSQGATPATDPEASDQAFVRSANQAGLMEVEASRIAQEVSASEEIRSFAGKMIADHGKASAELEQIAGKKSLSVPGKIDAEQAAKLQALRSKTGADFNAAYAMQMSDDHAAAVALFEAGTRLRDAELAAFAGRTLPVLRMHKQMADELNASHGK